MTSRSRKYVEASKRLQRYADINRSDTAFAKDGEIIYVFDTSVLEAYWRRAPAAVGGKFGTDDLFKRHAAKLSGWMSLKFLFEQRLPGMRSSAFISPAHWNEALDRMARLEWESRNSFKQTAFSKEVDSGLRDLLAFDGSKRELIERAKAQNLDAVFTTVMHALSWKDRIHRIFISGRAGEPAVRDLSLCSAYSTSLTGPVRPEDFRRWLARIHVRRAAQEQERNAEHRVLSRNNESDALTLATIQSLYRETPQALGRRPEVRFVFVTPDFTLHEAFGDLEDLLKQQGIPSFIRHPHVYSPLLNHLNMTGPSALADADAIKGVFSDVENALNALLPSGFPSESLFAASKLRGFESNVDFWSDTVETLCLSHGDYILNDAIGDYVGVQDVARLLSTPDVREAAAESVKAELERIRDDHFQRISALAFGSLPGKPHKTGNTATRFRAPVEVLDVDLASAIEGPTRRRVTPPSGWLSALLANFHSNREPKALGIFLRDLQEAWADPKRTAAAHLLATCIYLAVGAWDSARTCAELCKERLRGQHARRSNWMREAQYCEALAIRMQMRSKEDFELARRLLVENLAHWPQSLAHVRDKVEHASLVLTAVITQAIEADLQSAPSDAPFIDLIRSDLMFVEFQDAYDEIVTAIREIEGYEVSGSDIEAAQRIRIQAETNRLGALLFHHVLGPRVSDAPPDSHALAAAFSSLSLSIDGVGVQSSTTTKAYLHAAEFLLDQCQDKASRLVAFLDSLEVAGGEITVADRLELSVFRRVASARLAGATGIAA